MALTPTSIGNNPQQPVIAAETFIPDQLIAGDLKIVSDSVTVSGSAALLRGSVMGRTKFGSVSGSTGTAFASGTIAIGAVVDGDTLTIGGTAITFKNAVFDVAPPANTVYIGATTAATAQALLALLEASTDANLVKFTYTLSASTITATAAAIGTGGNSLTLATSDSGAITLSGATLTGGVANTGNATLSLMAGGAAMKAGNFTATCLTATTAQVVNPLGEEIGVATFGTTFVDAEIAFRITAGGTPCVAGDQFVLTAAPAAAGLYKLCTAAAIDGSQDPVAILADSCDPSSGNVTAGVYLTGEFNGNAMILDPSLSLAGVKAAFQNGGRDIFVKTSVSALDPS